eukprot:c27643_g1_i1 orf=246-1742(-)
MARAEEESVAMAEEDGAVATNERDGRSAVAQEEGGTLPEKGLVVAKHDERLDVVIFGASGFAGKYVVREMLKFVTHPDGQACRRVGLAGRSISKLADALAWAATPLSPPDFTFITADVRDMDSLKAMCKKTRLVISCVGPYRLYGEPVVAACVEEGIDYLDIAGEPEFMEKIEQKYHSKAKEVGCLIVSACGYDSIPAEMGLSHHLRQWEDPSVPNNVDALLHLRSSKPIRGNFGTWHAAVLGLANAGELKKMRQEKKKQNPDATVKVLGAPARKPSLLSRNKELGLWAVRLPSADASVVRRTQAAIASGEVQATTEEGEDEMMMMMMEKKGGKKMVFKPVHFNVYLALDSVLSVLAQMWTAFSLVSLAGFKCGRKLLLKYPGFFTCGHFKRHGPSEDELNAATFHLWFLGQGYKNMCASVGSFNTKVVTRVSGPEIGYIATSICLIQCALVVLDQRRSLPRGGVLTPMMAFRASDLEDRLSAHGLSFDFISKGKTTS